jgi:hypothetical protein
MWLNPADTAAAVARRLEILGVSSHQRYDPTAISQIIARLDKVDGPDGEEVGAAAREPER